MIDQQAQRQLSRKWILILMTGFWSLILTSCQSPQSTGKESPSVAQKRATLDYWNGLYELNLQLNQRASEIVTSLGKGGQDGSSSADFLPTFAKAFTDLDDAYTKSVTQLPVMNVDERLIKETIEDLSSGDELIKHLNAMTDAAISYANWNHRKEHPDGGKIFSDLVYSCISGFEGRPFAGYDKITNEEASLDAEGQQILGVYLQHAQAFNNLLEQARADDVKELALRAYLAKKYGTEFKPMPKPDSDNQTK